MLGLLNRGGVLVNTPVGDSVYEWIFLGWGVIVSMIGVWGFNFESWMGLFHETMFDVALCKVDMDESWVAHETFSAIFTR